MAGRFHIVCEVFQPDAHVPGAEVIRRIGVLRGERFAGHPVPRPVFAGGKEGVSPLEAYASHGWRKAG